MGRNRSHGSFVRHSFPKETMNTPDEIIAVVTAYKGVQRIQRRGFGASDQWETVMRQPTWNFSANEYRIAPEPRMVPLEAAIDYVNESAADLIRDLRARAEKDGGK